MVDEEVKLKSFSPRGAKKISEGRERESGNLYFGRFGEIQCREGARRVARASLWSGKVGSV